MEPDAVIQKMANRAGSLLADVSVLEAVVEHLQEQLAVAQAQEKAWREQTEKLVKLCVENGVEIPDGEAEESEGSGERPGSEATPISAERAAPPAEHEPQEVSGDYFPGKAN